MFAKKCLIKFLSYVVSGITLMVGAVSCVVETDSRPTNVPSISDYTLITSNDLVSVNVVKVIDAATIEVEFKGTVLRVKYFGIEVPTVGTSLGDMALDFNRFLVEGKTVDLEGRVEMTDEYGVGLRYVYVDGSMVNTRLLSSGYARVSHSQMVFKYRRDFVIAEERAKQERRGYWKLAISDVASSGILSPVPEPFRGGTLPSLLVDADSVTQCDFSSSTNPVIKGNVESVTKKRIYYTPNNLLYSTVEIIEEEGDRWFCSENSAMSAGWSKAKH